MQNAEHSINTLWGLKKQGVRISMDDFGTGYSSLNYLKRFPIDRIKLDQSFVRDLPGDKDDAAIAMAVIAMGRSLELVVIAEGVETEEQLAFLKDRDCDQLQGFLFSRPLPAEAFETLPDDTLGPRAERGALPLRPRPTDEATRSARFPARAIRSLARSPKSDTIRRL